MIPLQLQPMTTLITLVKVLLFGVLGYAALLLLPTWLAALIYAAFALWAMWHLLLRVAVWMALPLLLCVATQGALFPTNPVPTVTLAWDASVGATGYKIYKGPSTRNYTNVYDAGSNQIYTVRGGFAYGQRIYFAATAYNLVGESDFSQEVSWLAPSLPESPTSLRTTNALLKVSVETAPAPGGPWSPLTTLSTITSSPGFFRSRIEINPPINVKAVRVLKSPKQAALSLFSGLQSDTESASHSFQRSLS